MNTKPFLPSKSIVGTMVCIALVGCGSSSSDSPEHTPAPVTGESRTVSLSVVTENVMAFDGELALQQGSSSTMHTLETQGYEICIDDESNLNTPEAGCDTVIDGFNLFNDVLSLDITGSASISIYHPGKSTRVSYTVDGYTEISEDESKMLINMVNTQWSMVKLKDSDDIVQAEIDGVNLEKSSNSGFYTVYINKESVMTVDTYTYSGLSVEIPQLGDFKSNYIYNYVLDFNENGDLIITPPNFEEGEPIEIPAPDHVIDPTQVTGADVILNDDGSATLEVFRETGNIYEWYNEGQTFSSIASIDVTFTDGKVLDGLNLYMNIYLQKGEGRNADKVRLDFYGGKYHIQGGETFDSLEAAQAIYGDWTIRAYLDASINPVKGANFITRIKNHNQSQLTVTSYEVKFQ
ncbi:hypothetical protein [Photobacterium rosenbergii]|uniref:hypothetical protein n=1 Tax=Photobacterium rosenbergii TaxID=294936 RepID=UPI001C996210|nr:hypothetical protein [Photobacterium rosenbergii]MBY5945691.1 hypothetical protein [Photobacterium rosenbergii]